MLSRGVSPKSIHEIQFPMIQVGWDSCEIHLFPICHLQKTSIPYLHLSTTQATHPHLRPLYLNSQLLSLLFDAQASELSSRMSAMKAATDNAKECRGREEAGARGARGDGVGR